MPAPSAPSSLLPAAPAAPAAPSATAATTAASSSPTATALRGAPPPCVPVYDPVTHMNRIQCPPTTNVALPACSAATASASSSAAAATSSAPAAAPTAADLRARQPAEGERSIASAGQVAVCEAE